ncbi:hypothetical protein GGI07_005674 [Coemansia sp. Benny D115]|nr:hypothetical protein GGI07_005674 [Coemansia sp. Benny D115]
MTVTTAAPTLTLIAAIAASNRGIGSRGKLPWKLPGDLAYFNGVTSQAPPNHLNACILGRVTWDFIPKRFRPLDNRYNIVISSNPDLLADEQPPHTVVLPSVAQALEHVAQINASNDSALKIHRVFICGGHGIYKEALEMTETHPVQILLTEVQLADASACDAFFPEFDRDRFVRQPHARLEQVAARKVASGTQSENGIDYEFVLYEPSTATASLEQQ